MNPITGYHEFLVMQRHTDVSGISGTGPVAYVIDLGFDGQLLLWDTSVGPGREIPTHGIEIMPNPTLVEMIHGHDGATTVDPLVDPEHNDRLEHLLTLASHRLARVTLRLGAWQLDPYADHLMPTPREALRRYRLMETLRETERAGKTPACQLLYPESHADCAGLAAEMNDGEGCLCFCHDTDEEFAA